MWGMHSRPVLIQLPSHKPTVIFPLGVLTFTHNPQLRGLLPLLVCVSVWVCAFVCLFVWSETLGIVLAVILLAKQEEEVKHQVFLQCPYICDRRWSRHLSGLAGTRCALFRDHKAQSIFSYSWFVCCGAISPYQSSSTLWIIVPISCSPKFPIVCPISTTIDRSAWGIRLLFILQAPLLSCHLAAWPGGCWLPPPCSLAHSVCKRSGPTSIPRCHTTLAKLQQPTLITTCMLWGKARRPRATQPPAGSLLSSQALHGTATFLLARTLATTTRLWTRGMGLSGL